MCQALYQVLDLLRQDSGHALSPVVAPAPQLVKECLRVVSVHQKQFSDLNDQSCLRQAPVGPSVLDSSSLPEASCCVPRTISRRSRWKRD